MSKLFLRAYAHLSVLLVAVDASNIQSLCSNPNPPSKASFERFQSVLVLRDKPCADKCLASELKEQSNPRISVLKLGRYLFLPAYLFCILEALAEPLQLQPWQTGLIAHGSEYS